MSLPLEIEREFSELRNGSRFLRAAPGASKDKALLEIASRLLSAEAELLRANAEDLARLPSDALPSFRDRLTITSERLGGMLESLRQVAALPDPVGEVVEQRVLANGLKIRRVRSPLGVIFMVFESRPNVALEAFSLAFKAGNTIGLRGGRDSASTVAVLYRVMREALVASGFPASSFYGMTDYDRAHVTSVLQRKDLFDIAVPIIKNDRGLCHAYVDDEADLDMAVDIVDNAKTQRPGVCNSLETVLVNSKVADEFLRKLVAKTASKNLHYRADQRSLEKLQSALSAPSSNASSAAASSLGSSASSSSQSTPVATLATSIDFDTEYLDLILNVKIVADLSEAIAHIEKHGSRHSETIITRNESKARRFQSDIDAAAVYWNASTRFTDGFALGLGGELGISTQKLHVRGPVGLRELTTPRWIIDGTGQIRS
jgi:glutamate-5-semialdehyde dehydrogenase